MRHALAILTYVPSGARPELRRRLPCALDTLDLSGYAGEVFVVDDASTDADHLRFLASLPGRYRVVRRERNGGISRAKNTCIRAMMEVGVDVGFIAEDDISFRPGWTAAYLAAHSGTGIHHFSWAWDADPSGRMKKRRKVIRGHAVVHSSLVNGLLLTFTRRVIELVGGFRVLPGKWGHTHTNWTRRIVKAKLAPFFADVVNSNRLIAINPYGSSSAIGPEQRRTWERANHAPAHDLTRLHFPLEE